MNAVAEISRPNLAEAAPAESTAPAVQPQTLEQQLLEVVARRPARNRNPGEPSSAVAGPAEPAAPAAEPVAPTEPESAEPDVDVDTAEPESPAPTDNDADVSAVVDFLDFAQSNPQAKIRIPNKNAEGGFVELTAEKAASILGQGSAMHEEHRQFKMRQSEFEKYEQQRREQLDSLGVALEFTVQPELEQAYQDIARAQSYNQEFQQQLAQTSDPGEQAKIQASIQQNEAYINHRADYVRKTRPALDQYREHRRQQVESVVKNSREAFRDAELKNEYAYNELRQQISQGWSAAEQEFVPGVKNIDLISTDEHILGLLRDGLKFRQKPRSVQESGQSRAAGQLKTGRSTAAARQDPTEDLRARAQKGDARASRDLLSMYLQQQKAQRKGA